MATDALEAWNRWYRDPERGGGCWCRSYPPCEGKAAGRDTCPNMPAAIREEGERLWRQAEPTRTEKAMAVRRIPLLPHAGIYLEAFGYADDAHFARVFRHTWRRLPMAARRSILAHWRGMERGGWHRRVKIEVLPDWSQREDEFGVGVLGSVNGAGEIRFWAPFVQQAPRRILEWLIAHELAHCYQNANPDTDFGDVEESAENLAWEWLQWEDPLDFDFWLTYHFNRALAEWQRRNPRAAPPKER